MSECEKCIRAQDQRDPMGAVTRAMVRAHVKAHGPVWQVPDLPDVPRLVCIDCPACGGHWLVNQGEQWCGRCAWELSQVEQHVGPPVETGWKVGDPARWNYTTGKVQYVDPSGFVDLYSGGWTIRVDDPAELVPVEDWPLP